jgi:hypothetical protein
VTVEERIAAAVQAAALDIALDLERMAHLVPVFAASQGFRTAAERVCHVHGIDHVLMVARPVARQVELDYENGRRTMKVGNVAKGQDWSDFAIRGDLLICPACGEAFGQSYDELVSVVRPHVQNHKDQDEWVT